VSGEQTSSAPRATLLVESVHALEPFEIESGAIIGRDKRNDVAIDHPTVSRRHARIELGRSGWRIIDLNSANGSSLNEQRIAGRATLKDGAALQIGRVRAWFFAGPVPEGWAPSADVQLAGKLMRCLCGHIGWVPEHAAGMRLPCKACGRDVVVQDSVPSTIDEQQHAVATCAACHTSIWPHEPMHRCVECDSTMHVDCWNENRGCATYGCPQVNVLDDASPEASPELSSTLPTQDLDPVIDDEEGESLVAPPLPDGLSTTAQLRRKLAELSAVTLLGLPTFGIPGIALSAYRLVKDNTRQEEAEGPKRYGWLLLSFCAGVVGFGTSTWWWLER
jgi:FHA domain